MIYSLRGLIPPADVQTQTPDGRWVSSMPLPWYPGLFERVTDAWAVLRERAVAVKYPANGEFEPACHAAGWTLKRRG